MFLFLIMSVYKVFRYAQTTIIDSHGDTTSALTVREKEPHFITALTLLSTDLLLLRCGGSHACRSSHMMGRPAPSEPLPALPFRFFYFNLTCMGVLHPGMSCLCPQKPERVSDSLKLEFSMIVSEPLWVLGTEAGSSTRAASALNH
ncbi:homer homolog 1 (Drosophila), isoform CRA_g [Rattus norvegicus]|uniref:Homer homolog 1 (Drosophila), isoform CRA_g n=1 Tax=Rattus norvegicus TaxID=10116 RepID=A6I4V0_RAT|nr:homer homolog 1 (Drosophila), isoform CRA_g [Rattus norvegicus]